MQDETARETFERLKGEWLEETGDMSVLSRKFAHPAYLQIIGMGWTVVPFLLDEVQKRSGHWFYALRSITGAHPAQPGDTYDAAAQAWLAWDRDRARHT